MNFNVPGYASLADVLQRAYNQAAKDKGAERHANSLPFDRQPMQSVAQHHGIGFTLGQAEKKSIEAHNMVKRGETARAIHELLGAMNYLAGTIIRIEADAASSQPSQAEPQAEPQSELQLFKTGDKVRIAEKVDQSKYSKTQVGWVNGMGAALGKIGKITDVDGADGSFRVHIPDLGSSWWFLGSDLTPVADADADNEPCDCPACTLRKLLGVDELEIITAEGDQSDLDAFLRSAFTAKK